MTILREVAEKAIEIYNQHAEGAEMDAGFDGGEWSGPAHQRMAEKAVQTLCEIHNVDFDDVQSEVENLEHKENDNA
jgi:hypothetical protein